jgi:hypothetical protein
VATAGDASANSFVTEDEVIAYMAARLNASSWTTVTGSTCTESEKKALVEATRELSARNWIGLFASDTQALAWPRQWATNPDSPTYSYFDTDDIPQRVKDATCELAFQFLKAGTSDVAALDSTQAVTRRQVDVIVTEYDSHAKKQGLERYPRVMNYIRPLLSGSPSVLKTVRG